MTPAVKPSNAPPIRGFEPIRSLGRGGFAEVFLYQQASPRRKTAVKILTTGAIGKAAVERLSAEADAMAELSSHPHIATVYASGLTDDGKPYLAMEYCPKPSLNAGLRRNRRPVGEVLEIGVQIAGAVETAHRAGILHRDIKPANILVTQYDNPALTDFGIAVSIQEASRGIEGLSVPWSPPEAFAAPPWSGPQSDVWGLAATLYSLLAQRAPFEVQDSDNSAAAQMYRIQHGVLPPIGRADCPASLEQVLAVGMTKETGRRYTTALHLGRALQRVQAELFVDPTRLVIQDEIETLPVGEDDDDLATRLRAPRPVGRSDPPVQYPPAAVPASSRPVYPTQVIAQAPRPATGAAIRPSIAHNPAPQPQPTKSRRGLTVALAGLATLAIGVVAVIFFILPGNGANQPADATSTDDGPPAAVDSDQVQTSQDNPAAGGSEVPAPEDLVGQVDGAMGSFTWTNPDPQPGDAYLWAVLDQAGQAGNGVRTTNSHATVPLDQNGHACVVVRIVRSNGHASTAPATACTP
ncbi:MAG: protein kinase [Micrococcales bacterium]|nr:protein kinase [Micrococcales bacterium]